MNHRITGLYLGVFIMLCAGLPVRAESMPTVSVLGVEDFAASTNAWEKIHYQLAEALVQKAGYQPLFRQLPWNRAMAYIRDGRLDLISSLSRTPEREAYIHFIGVATHEQ
nr:hypothetical protein [Thiolinea sp.]